ncbi:hypothetical protein VTN96DRAFT_7251 [Rasamsonia emersonii]
MPDSLQACLDARSVQTMLRRSRIREVPSATNHPGERSIALTLRLGNSTHWTRIGPDTARLKLVRCRNALRPVDKRLAPCWSNHGSAPEYRVNATPQPATRAGAATACRRPIALGADGFPSQAVPDAPRMLLTAWALSRA